MAVVLNSAPSWADPIRDDQVVPAGYSTSPQQSSMGLKWRARRTPGPSTLPTDLSAKPLVKPAEPPIDTQVRPVQADEVQLIVAPFAEDEQLTPIPDPMFVPTSQIQPPLGPLPDTPDLTPAPPSPLPGLGERAEIDLKVNCQDEYNQLRPIRDITTNIEPKAGEMPPECSLKPEDYTPRDWSHTTYTWKASGLCHKPLYFEEVALERYGHSTGKWSQPFVSGAHFFLTVPVLPYKMGMDPPWECKYPLGHYRPGSCAPYMIPPLPISLRGAAAEAATAVGLVYILP